MSASPAGPIFRAQGVCKTFADDTGADVVALSGIDLEIAAHEFVAVVGPSGCGKSTFLRMVAGLERPTSGAIEVNGAPVTGPGADRGMVFQEYALLPWKTTIANVAFGLQLAGMPKARREAVAQRYLDLVGLGGFETKHPHQLSGGMRQRAAVARALANNPAILLMDEPFAAIDAITRRRLQEELTDISVAERMTVLFITHSVEEAVFLADRVVVLSGRPGRVVAELRVQLGRPRRWETALADPTFARLRDRLLALVGDAGDHV